MVEDLKLNEVKRVMGDISFENRIPLAMTKHGCHRDMGLIATI